MAFESNSAILSSSGAADRVRNRGRHFQLVPETRIEGAELQLSMASAWPVTTPVPHFPMFMLKPPTVTADSENKALNVAVHLEWLKGRGAAWVSGSPDVAYLKDSNVFQLVPSDPGVPIVTESGLAAALDTLEDAALDECVARHLTEGGDDRLHIDPATGANKYFCPPRPVDNQVVIRGSCTCSPPSGDGFEAARALLRKLWQGTVSFEDACSDIRARISKAIGVCVPHHVILHPSGSDAELIPLLVGAERARVLDCSGIVNVVVAAGEVGSGTAPAAGGRHFSKFTPAGNMVDAGTIVSDFPEQTTVIEIKPRGSDGTVVPDFDALVNDAIVTTSRDQHRPFFIVHAVDGSKTGLRLPSRNLIDSLRGRLKERLLIVLDACQCRSEPEELNWYMGRGALVLITASKFYGAPGFCGAVLVPESAGNLLARQKAAPAGLSDYITRCEVPSALTGLYNSLPEGPKNFGLLMRWACGVEEMELFSDAGAMGRRAVRDWVRSVRALVCARRPTLELLDPEFEEGAWDGTRVGGVNSVVSIKFLSGCGTRHLDALTLRRVHRWLTEDASGSLPAHASAADREAAQLRCFVGQPVHLGSFGVLRLAIGAPMARLLAASPASLTTALRDDARILDKMAVLGKHCEDMMI